MKLQQGQIWKRSDAPASHLRIVQLERLQVGYKVLTAPDDKEGVHHLATKKEFCRLLKGATLVSTAPIRRS